MNAGSLSPNFVRELERLAAPGGHFSFFERVSIHEVSYGALEDWSLWLADRKQSPKSRRNFLGYMRSFLRWLELRGEIPKAPRVPSVRVEEHEPRIVSVADQDLILSHIPEADRGIFLALAHLGLRPGEARALQVADYRDGWLHVDKAAKSKSVSAEIRGTKTGKPKRLPVSEELAEWIERHVDPAGRFSAAPLFPEPSHGSDVGRTRRSGACGAAPWKTPELPHISLYEGTKHTMATDAIRRGVRSARSSASWDTRRCSPRAATRASPTTPDRGPAPLDEARRPTWRQVGDKVSGTGNRVVARTSAWAPLTRTRDPPVMSRVL